MVCWLAYGGFLIEGLQYAGYIGELLAPALEFLKPQKGLGFGVGGLGFGEVGCSGCSSYLDEILGAVHIPELSWSNPLPQNSTD